MRRLAVLSVLFGFAGALAVCFTMRGAPAAADSPEQQGWWTVLNPGTGGALPIPAQIPPDVPSNGLLVEGGSASSPSAYAALLYSLGQGASASTLTLQVTGNSATTPNSTLEICPLSSDSFTAEQGGPISGAPSYDCTKKVTASASSNGTSYQFDASSLVSNGTLAVAVLPTSPTDRVVFNAPDSNSLAAQAPTTSSGNTSSDNTSSALGGVSGGVSTPSSSGVSNPGGSFSVPASGTSPSGTSSSRSSSASQSPSTSRGQNLQAFQAFGTASQQAEPLAVALVAIGLIGGAALWIYAGRRRPDEIPV